MLTSLFTKMVAKIQAKYKKIQTTKQYKQTTH